MNTAMVLYAPVLHRGYLEFIERHNLQVERLYILDEDLIKEYKTSGYVEIRSVQPSVMCRVLDALGVAPHGKARLLNRASLKELQAESEGLTIIAPRLDILENLFTTLPGARITWDTVFLQWDSKSVMSTQVVVTDQVISTSDFEREIMKLGHQVGERSSDWWRHVGSVLVRDGEVVMTAYNHHVPDEQTQYILGDPRDFTPAGTDSHVATALHAEQTIITQAAREGVSLLGCDLYTPVFPCPMCAKQIAYSGIRRVYFESGHASVDGESILKSQGVEIVLVQ